MRIGQLNIWILSTLWAVAMAGFGWYCALMGQQITYVTLADGRRAERQIPLFFRLLLPWAPNAFPVVRRRAFEKDRARAAQRLVSAGFEGLLSDEEFVALRLLMPLVFGSVWIGLMVLLLTTVPTPMLYKMRYALCLFGPLWFALYPVMWLRRALLTRHRSIRRALPFALDILTLSVEAGMDFMTALQRHVERSKIDALNEELIRVLREIQLGKTRREALRDMAARGELSDLRSVINALVQADELGVSIGSILRIQADQIRQKRFDRAERLANEAPVKMLFPLMFFIFPAVFLILLGPVVVRMIQQGF